MPLAIAAATFWVNVAAAGNIVHGVKVVVIDAGHGGKFPGAHYGGVYEKTLTLNIALRLGKLIEEQMPGVEVVYTRKTDKALGDDLATDLQARADIANKAGGDLFISIHVNAARATAARGVETLIMGESPKEQRYNENALFENNREDLIDMSDARTAAIVRAYIQNLQFTYGEYSMAMARCIQNNYQKAGRHSRGIKPQLLRVLYATDMPGVLTEIGFMSNPEEFAFMKSEKGQDQIARSLLQAVKNYSDYVLGTRRGDGAQPAEPAQSGGDASGLSAAVTAPPVGQDTVAKLSGEGEAIAPEKAAVQQGEAGKAAPAKSEPAKKGVVKYAVQVLASTKAVPLSSSQFKSYKGKVKQYASAGTFRYKYCVGEYDDRAAAQKRLGEVRKVFPEAFVVKCDGKQILK